MRIKFAHSAPNTWVGHATTFRSYVIRRYTSAGQSTYTVLRRTSEGTTELSTLTPTYPAAVYLANEAERQLRAGD